MPRPDVAASLGNPAPAYPLPLDLPERPEHEREGLRLDIADAGAARVVDLARCRKILVVKLDFIGDWVLTTPFLANLRRNAPDAEITAVVLERVFDLARACRLVDQVVACGAADRGPVRVAAATPADRAAFAADYEGGFDLAVVPRWDADFNGALRVAAGARARHVVGFSETCTARRRRRNRGDDRFYSLALVDRRTVHEVEHNLALVPALGGTILTTQASLDIAPAARAAAGRFVRQAVPDPQRPLLAVAPFATGARQWPAARTAELARRLADRFGLAPVILASPDDARAAEDFAALVGGGAASAGGMRLAASAALIARSAVLLGMDSGPGHMAAALGTACVTISAHPATGAPGHTGAPERFRPWGDPSRVLVVRPAAAEPPCTGGCDADAPHCILGVGLEACWPRVEAFVAAALAPQPAFQA